jgi:hypothetical protein
MVDDHRYPSKRLWALKAWLSELLAGSSTGEDNPDVLPGP